jgi:hypothetical protein
MVRAQLPKATLKLRIKCFARLPALKGNVQMPRITCYGKFTSMTTISSSTLRYHEALKFVIFFDFDFIGGGK